MRAISIGYHDVDDGRQVSDCPLLPETAMWYKLGRREFHEHLASIRQQGPQISVRTIDRFRRWERWTPVFLTFDDGALSAYTVVADELERHNWRGHFFITTDWIGRPGFLDRRQIRELRARGHVVGSHTCSHPERMSRLSWSELVREWSDSCAILSDILGERVKAASVANGYYSSKVGRTAAASGIEVLFSSEPIASASVLDGCLILGRYSIQRHTPPAISGAIAAGSRWRRWQQTVLWQAKKPVKALTGESYLRIRRLILARELQEGSAGIRRAQYFD